MSQRRTLALVGRALWLAAALAIADRAVAQDAAQGSGGACIVQGTTQMPPDVLIYDKQQAGQPFARFTGGETPLSVSDFSASQAQARVRVQTGTGSGSFRLDGYVEAAKVPIYTKRNVPVVAGHVWIGTHQLVNVIGAWTGQLKVKKTLLRPMNQSFSGAASCDSFTLEASTPPGWTVPGHARGYVVKQDSIELYEDAEEGRVVVTLHRAADGDGILLWSSERKGGWVHVEYHGEVVIDAWARARDVQALPPGERMDEAAGPTIKKGTPRVSLQNAPRLVTTTREVPIRIKAADASPVVGRIEPNTETYVLDVMAGWASVLPKSLNVTPHGDYHFWVKASDLGLATAVVANVVASGPRG